MLKREKDKEIHKTRYLYLKNRLQKDVNYLHFVVKYTPHKKRRLIQREITDLQKAMFWSRVETIESSKVLNNCLATLY